ncbi:MAG: tRNA (adenosine(37)-N6)-dimethylallyltransferase MiaA [Actinobacteria bacterium]|nr:tRNA (adenosine(37)-N6)-dimethylallyltransferase MiaA [Actinomycetota bacterium]
MTEPVLALFGPTASGKTAVAEAVAERIPAEIVSADSMQVYRGLPILTAQPERPTRLVAVWELDHDASVGEYQHLAQQAIDEILAAGKAPIVVGGTGLYFRAALADLDLPPAPTPGARERWESIYDEQGGVRAHGLLSESDPETAATVHPNDRRRVVRALELAESGVSLRAGQSRLWTDATRHPTVVFGLDLAKEELDQRIEARAREMFAKGVRAEVERALSAPMSDTARHALGLAELAEHSDDEPAVEALIRRTRRYASYQRKWMRRIPDLVSLPANRPPGETADEILEVARARQRLPAGRAG